MRPATATDRREVPPELIAEAGVWVARLHGPERTAAVEGGFRQWLQTSADHARAFELATDIWEEARNLRRVVQRQHVVPAAHFVRRAAAAAVLVLLAVGGALFYLRQAGVSTEVGEQRMLTLADGTRVFLNTATHLVVRYDDSERRVELKRGEALFDVAKRRNRPFLVALGDREVRALGTSFVVRRDERGIAVTLVEGRVEVSATVTDDRSSAPGADIVRTLSPGERLTFAAAGDTVEIDRPVLERVTAWRRGQVILDDTPLAEAIDEMNRYSAVKLSVDNSEAADLRVNGLFQAGDSESFARAVAQTHGLLIVAEPDRIRLAGAPAHNPVD